MIRVLLQGHSLTGPVEEILRPFTTDIPKSHVESGVESIVEGNGGDFTLSSSVSCLGAEWTIETRDEREASITRTLCVEPSDEGSRASPVPVPVRREVKRQLYFLLSERTGFHPPWGSLTGVRPTVMAMEALASGMDPASSARSLEERFGVSAAKAELAVRTARMEEEILGAMPMDEPCIYVSVPFCSSRCSYCSFPSCTVDRVRDRLPAYIDAILQEAERVGKRLACENRKAGCLYVGGGSPAVLPADLIDRMLRGLRRRIPFQSGCESTFEAGRSDDLDESRLSAIAANDINRICINPQTTDPSTLSRIGRPDPGERMAHWVGKVRSAGIRVLNMDLIAGLPKEEGEAFQKSLEDVLALSPDNVTLHALSRKRGSGLSAMARAPERGGGAATEMVDLAHARLDAAGFAPYYLYRQKDAADGLENTGFARPGTACRYNVAMMSDRRDVFGLGAGASTKRMRPGTSRIDRDVHPLELTTYLDRIARLGSLG